MADSAFTASMTKETRDLLNRADAAIDEARRLVAVARRLRLIAPGALNTSPIDWFKTDDTKPSKHGCARH
jgi:hypothetical protein